MTGDQYYGPWYFPFPFTLPSQQTPPPMGCICPPTSEKTCENQMCPRKRFKIEVTSCAPIKGDGK